MQLGCVPLAEPAQAAARLAAPPLQRSTDFSERISETQRLGEEKRGEKRNCAAVSTHAAQPQFRSSAAEREMGGRDGRRDRDRERALNCEAPLLLLGRFQIQAQHIITRGEPQKFLSCPIPTVPQSRTAPESLRFLPRLPEWKRDLSIRMIS